MTVPLLPLGIDANVAKYYILDLDHVIFKTKLI